MSEKFSHAQKSGRDSFNVLKNNFYNMFFFLIILLDFRLKGFVQVYEGKKGFGTLQIFTNEFYEEIVPIK